MSVASLADRIDAKEAALEQALRHARDLLRAVDSSLSDIAREHGIRPEGYDPLDADQWYLDLQEDSGCEAAYWAYVEPIQRYAGRIRDGAIARLRADDTVRLLEEQFARVAPTPAAPPDGRVARKRRVARSKAGA